MENKKVVIPGGTGFIGKYLSKKLAEEGWQVTVFSRKQKSNVSLPASNIHYVQWDISKQDEWIDYLEGAHAIINLMGENISALRWTKKKKQKIRDSRISTGEMLFEAIKNLKNKPEVLIQISGIGVYGDRRDQILDENSAVSHTGFLSDIIVQLEKKMIKINKFGIRFVSARTAIVLGKKGGFLNVVKLPFLFFFGGHMGNEQQWISWIHIKDYVNAINYLLQNQGINGAVNLTAPNSVKVKDFYRSMGKVMNRPSWFHVPSFLLKLIMGQVANELILPSQRAFPSKLLHTGFNFLYPDVDAAFNEIIK